MKKTLKNILTSLACFCSIAAFTSCAPTNVEKAAEKMENLNYTVVNSDLSLVYLNRTLGLEGIENGAEGFIATNILAFESLNVYYFESASDAKIFFNEWVLPKRDSYYWENVDQRGKMVCYGSNKAYNDFI